MTRLVLGMTLAAALVGGPRLQAAEQATRPNVLLVKAAAAWEEPGPSTRSALQTVATEGTPERSLGQALDALRRQGLCD